MGMDLAQAVRLHLRSQSALTAYVTTGGIHPIAIPQGADLPRVTYQQISRSGVRASSTDPKLEMFRIQVSCFSTSYSQAKAVAKQTKTALQDYKTQASGLFGDGTSGVDVQRIFFDGEIDMMAVEPGTVTNVYHIVQDYLVWAST